MKVHVSNLRFLSLLFLIDLRLGIKKTMASVLFIALCLTRLNVA
jgi:hypothetical protein